VFLADVSEESAVERLRDQVNESLGSADILINNAGIILRKRMLDLSTEEWNRVIQTNLTGPFLCARAFAPG
jgi:NAD(P)-dependent dehydrogenase (short-subunit alcohol dehydrogenase family)